MVYAADCHRSIASMLHYYIYVTAMITVATKNLYNLKQLNKRCPLFEKYLYKYEYNNKDILMNLNFLRGK